MHYQVNKLVQLPLIKGTIPVKHFSSQWTRDLI